MKPQPGLESVAAAFQMPGTFVRAEAYGSGHINDTYRVQFAGGAAVHYIFQRINHRIFKNPVALMENIERVTSHLARRASRAKGGVYRGLVLMPAGDGRVFHCDEAGNYWRVYNFVERACSFDVAQSPGQAFEAAKAFGHFQQQLADLPAPRLHDTIPDFHHTPKRFAALEEAIEADAANRAKLAEREIGFALRHKEIAQGLLNAGLPERVTHNDTKLNNVMFDDTTGEGVCVIDLDTVMPGLVLYDFGDMVRTTTSPMGEDERDLSKIEMRFPMFEALARGYFSTASGFLTEAEKRQLVFSGKLITFEIGIRFLTDFLAGDTYFKVHRDGQNLDRCRAQFALLESIARQEDRMQKLVESL